MAIITSADVYDVRFPTSLTADGSDAMNKLVDNSAAYMVLHTDDPELSGFGFTYTTGHGNDICAAAMRLRVAPLIGMTVPASAAEATAMYELLKGDSQLRWLGPEKGVEHLALAGVMNAVWDLAARRAGVPLWRYLADLSPAELVEVADFQYIEDALTKSEALAMLENVAPGKAQRIAELEERGYPCYTTSAGWLGYSDEKLERLLVEAVDAGYSHVKLKVGADRDDDIRRCAIARRVIGEDGYLMIDANQIWDVPTAIDWLADLAPFRPHWIEEPTSPDDVLGHAAIRTAVAPMGVATGENGMNRVLFKQMFQAGAYDFCQLDPARLGSINEIVAVYLMAAKYDIPVCPHAGGVGLCELAQHLSIFDYVAVSASLENRITEYVDHLHEHFVDPCVVTDGAYRLPREPGYSAQMYPASIEEHLFPDGPVWSALRG